MDRGFRVKDSPATPKDQSTSANQGVAQISLLGASFDTGNLGVSALAESSVKCILGRWPNARVTLLGGGREEGVHRLSLSGRDIMLSKMPIRFSKNILLPEHFCRLALRAALWRLLPFGSVRKRLARGNRHFRSLLETDCFIDISGGDSFSDIYGMRRLTLGFLTRLLPLMLKKNFLLFPQTYGPFKRRVARTMARYVLRRAKLIYSRDRAGLEYTTSLMAGVQMGDRLRFAPDVAFVLDARRPPEQDWAQVNRFRSNWPVLVGLNVSGLLYYGGYTDRNEFGLKLDYREMIDGIVESLLRTPDVGIVLVPHVIPRGDFRGSKENDLHACLDVQVRMSKTHPDRLFVVQSECDQAQIKCIIGLCQFFLGARMHSCIGALSQGIPAIGLAYSKKFRGVFETVGVEDLVLDMRSATAQEIVAAVDGLFKTRQAIAERLRERIPVAQRQVQDLLKDVDL